MILKQLLKICISKFLYCYRKDLPKNVDKTTAQECNTEVDGRTPSQDGSVVFESKEGHYDNIGKMNTNDAPEVDGRKPTQGGNVVFEKRKYILLKMDKLMIDSPLMSRFVL